jgi:hypothetical protein
VPVSKARSSHSGKNLQFSIITITYNADRDGNADLLKGISGSVELTREDVKTLVSNMQAPIDKPTALSKIPLEPKQEDYIHIKFWENSPWQAIKNKSQPKDLDADSPIISLYMEDEDGQPIARGIKGALRKDVYSYWNELFWADSNDLRNHGDLGIKRKEHFRRTFEEMYPWLRLCEGHWKVDQLWMSYFSTWKKPRRSESPDPKSKESTPIDVSSDGPAPPTPAGIKRRLEEHDSQMLEDPSKRQRGDIPSVTNFHHSRAPRKKTPVRMAKVCRASLFLS